MSNGRNRSQYLITLKDRDTDDSITDDSYYVFMKLKIKYSGVHGKGLFFLADFL